MSKMVKSPAKYVQGPHVLEELDKYLDGMGNRLLVIISQSGAKRIGPTLEQCFAGKDYALFYHIFAGESTLVQVETISQEARDHGCTAVVGIGGGKIIDTAKSVSHLTGLPCVTVPTVASTNAPSSSLSILYHDNGEFDRYFFLSHCPEVVIADTAVMAGASSRLTVAGMGDAMATWFEARACRRSGSENQVHAQPTRGATGLAKMCWENLRQNGLAAKIAIDNHLTNEALEIVVETNTYLSGIGFESGGLAAAHGIQKGFTMIPELREQLHGFNVAFCVLAQLVLENSLEEMVEVMEFSTSVGLPICFADLGYPDVDPAMVRLAAEKATVPTSTIHHMPFTVTAEMVYQSLMAADAYGRAFHEGRL